MEKKRFNKMVVATLSSIILLLMCSIAFAYTSGNDYMDSSSGMDAYQDKSTAYRNDSMDNLLSASSSSVDVYATKASCVQYYIPQVIVIDAKSGEASCQVGVKGDISSKQQVYIYMPSDFMISDGKRNYNVKIEQEKCLWEYDEINLNSYSYSQAYLTCASDLGAGVYSGSFNLQIGVNVIE